EDREIDAIRYPHFAALAENAYWFRNATSVADYTNIACPAMLSGLYPDKPRLPTFADYPHNIFTLLGGAYNMVVDDPNTKLCPNQLLSKGTEAGIRNNETLKQRLKSLLVDSSVAYLHIIIPTDLCSKLPVVTRRWRNFMGDDHGTQERNIKQNKSKPLPRDFWLNHVTGERPMQIRRFIESIHFSEKPTLYYLHPVIPHEPWRYLPSGKEYCQPAEYKTIRGLDEFGTGETWGPDEWAVIQAYQRYLLQVGFVDKLLGAIIDRVKDVGLYDRSLIIITADHGVSFRVNDKRRPISMTNYQDIMSVPLFIKIPNQVKGVISDRNVESIDIVPSIAHILDIYIPWQIDGQSVFNRSLSERNNKLFFRNSGDKRKLEMLEFKRMLNERYDTLDRMLALFGSGKRSGGLYKVGPHSKIIDKRISEIEIIKESEIMVKLDQEKAYEQVDLNSPFVPAQVTGLAMMKRTIKAPLYLAVSVNGIIRAVTRTYPYKDTVHEWSAVVPESSFQEGSNRVEVFHLIPKTGYHILERTRKKEAVTYYLSGSDKQDDESITSSEGASIAVIPGAVKGFVDHAGISNDRIKFSGWAADIKRSEVPEAILIFVDGDLLFSGRMNTKRPDVSRKFSDQALQWSGFSYALLLDPFRHKKKPEVRIFALAKRGIASELTYPKGYQWTNKS
ncbi:MAG: sulfatase-like hydrolase/transferase, partial [Dissulfuribacterales bacterium]